MIEALLINRLGWKRSQITNFGGSINKVNLKYALHIETSNEHRILDFFFRV